jgi:hypothetical protein
MKMCLLVVLLLGTACAGAITLGDLKAQEFKRSTITQSSSSKNPLELWWKRVPDSAGHAVYRFCAVPIPGVNGYNFNLTVFVDGTQVWEHVTGALDRASYRLGSPMQGITCAETGPIQDGPGRVKWNFRSLVYK